MVCSRLDNLNHTRTKSLKILQNPFFQPWFKRLMDAEDIVDQNGFSASRRRFFRSRSNGLLGLLGKTGPEEPKEQGKGCPLQCFESLTHLFFESFHRHCKGLFIKMPVFWIGI